MASAAKGPLWSATAKLPAYSPLTSDDDGRRVRRRRWHRRAHHCLPAYPSWEVGGRAGRWRDWQRHDRRDDGAPRQCARRSLFRARAIHGERGSRLAAESHTAAIDRIESIVSRERIDCDFERLDGYLFCAPEHDEALLDRELAAAHRAGLHNVAKVGRAPTGVRHRRLPALSEPGAVPSAEVPRRPRRARSSAAAAASTPARMPRTSRAARRERQDPKRRHPSTRQHRRRHQHAGQRSRRRAHQAGAVHDLRDRRARCRAARSLPRAATGTPAIRITTSGCIAPSMPATIC